MSSDGFRAIYDRLLRAQEHLEVIKGELLTYYGSDLGNIRGQFKTKPPIVRITGYVVGPSPRFHTVVGEFLHDVRSSLDHLAWQLVLENGGTPVEGHTRFPILKVRPTASSQGIHPLPNVVGGVSNAALTLVDEAQPYYFGDAYAAHPFWVLHALWNIDKHRHIAVAGSRLDGFVLTSETPPFTFTLMTSSFNEHGAEIVVVADDPKVDANATTTLRMMVHEPAPGLHMPLYEILVEAHTAVMTTVTACEDTCL